MFKKTISNEYIKRRQKWKGNPCCRREEKPPPLFERGISCSPFPPPPPFLGDFKCRRVSLLPLFPILFLPRFNARSQGQGMVEIVSLQVSSKTFWNISWIFLFEECAFLFPPSPYHFFSSLFISSLLLFPSFLAARKCPFLLFRLIFASVWRGRK